MEEPGSKACTLCREVKPFSFFVKSRTTKDGLHSHCKMCKNKNQRADYKRNIPAALQRQRTINYGISLEEYQELYTKQRGVCASCGNPETRTFQGRTKNLSVDHCHKSGVVRGLLCHDCNT